MKKKNILSWFTFFVSWLAVFVVAAEPVPSGEAVVSAPPPVILGPAVAGPHVTGPFFLAGRVVDRHGEPIAGVTLEIVNTPAYRTASDAEGRYHLSDIPALEAILLKISKDGYLPLYVSYLLPLDTVARTAGRHTLYPLVDDTLSSHSVRKPVSITADHFNYERDRDIYRAVGDVLVTYDTGVLTAPEVEINATTNKAVAHGPFLLRSGGDRLEGQEIRLDMDTKNGSIDQGRLFLERNHFYIRGDRIEKRGEATYFIEKGTATTCDGEVPDWKLTGREMEVTVDGYGTIKDGGFQTRDIPVLYVPYLFFPAKTTRQSGFLFPYLSYSRDKLGMDVQVPFFWAVSERTDATLYQRYMSDRGFQEGVEVRYFPRADSFGTLYLEYLKDTKPISENTGTISREWPSGETRYAFYLNHETTFSPGFYIRADIAKVSDSWYFRDFTSHNYFLDHYSTKADERFQRVSFLGDESLASLDATTRLVKDWGLYNLTALVRYTDDFTKQTNDATLQKYPEITLTAIRQPLLETPLHYEFSSVYDYYYRGEGQKGHLYDLQPTFSLPMGLGHYAQLTPFVGWKGTFWSRDDQNTLGNDTRQGERQVFNGGATISAEVQKIFAVNGESFDKLRHSIKPELTYTYVPNARQDGLPDFVTRINEQNTLAYALTNTLTARMKDKNGRVTYQEIVRMKLTQAFDILEARRTQGLYDSPNRPFGEVGLELDLTPHPLISFAARNKYDVNGSQWTQTNYDMILRDTRGDNAIVGYRYTLNTLEEVNLSLKVVVTPSLDLTYVHRRNRHDDKDVERTYGLNYRRQCWNVQFSYSDNISYIANGAEKPDRFFVFKVALQGL